MNQCKNCGVWVEGLTCPLCHRGIADPTTTTEVQWYPDYQEVSHDQRSVFAFKLTIFIAVSIVSGCLLINLLTMPHKLWSLYVATVVVYLLITCNHTILSKSHLGGKILVQLISLSGLLSLTDALMGFQRWSVNYIVPFLVVAATFLVTVIILKKRMRWRAYVGFVVTMIVLGFLPIVLYVAGVATAIWPSAVTALYALLTLFGMLLFSDKTFKTDLVRRFHL
ncbi:hypothetical protein JOC34_001262 [Virgibacillus halotolerans]|uniref:DUF6320 domain-containing protein n=1 Tax=Virgibacillus halotolerans TaxID=1071053 RepID=UPI001960A38D|nr:hypothetical protein [Virgibacillus halotolerans]